MYTWTAPVSPRYLSCCSFSWMRGEATLSATLEASNNEHQDIILTKRKQPKKKQTTNILNWIESLGGGGSSAVITNSQMHTRSIQSYDIQYKQTLKKTPLMLTCLHVHLCHFFLQFCSLRAYQNISEVYEWDKKNNTTKKCSHYIIGAFFLIQVFVFRYFVLPMICLSSCLGGGDWNVREWKTEIRSYTDCIRCAYSTQVFC